LLDSFKLGFTGPDKAKFAPSEALKTRQVEYSTSVGVLLDYKYAFKCGFFVGGEFLYESLDGKVILPKSVSDVSPKFNISLFNVGALVGYYFLMGQARPYIMGGVDINTEKLDSGKNDIDVHLQTTSPNLFLGGGCDWVAPFGLVLGGGLRFDYDLLETFHDRAGANSADKTTYTFNRLPLGVVAHIGYKF